MFQESMSARIVRILAALMAMVVITVLGPAPASAQTPNHATLCRRASFTEVYATSIEGVPSESFDACLSGAVRPTPQLITSWDALRSLRDLRRIEVHLRPGVERTALPSPGEFALANYRALSARCVLRSEHGEAREEGRRHRVRLSRSAMREHPWNVAEWFPAACEDQLSLAVRAGVPITLLTRIERSDALVRGAIDDIDARRVASLDDLKTLMTSVRPRLLDAVLDPVPLALVHRFALSLLEWVSTFSPTPEPIVVYRERVVYRTRSESRELREARERARDLLVLLIALGVVTVVVGGLTLSYIEGLKGQVKRLARDKKALSAKTSSAQLEGMLSVFTAARDGGSVWMESRPDLPRLYVRPAQLAVTEALVNSAPSHPAVPPPPPPSPEALDVFNREAALELGRCILRQVPSQDAQWFTGYSPNQLIHAAQEWLSYLNEEVERLLTAAFALASTPEEVPLAEIGAFLRIDAAVRCLKTRRDMMDVAFQSYEDALTGYKREIADFQSRVKRGVLVYNPRRRRQNGRSTNTLPGYVLPHEISVRLKGDAPVGSSRSTAGRRRRSTIPVIPVSSTPPPHNDDT